MFYTNKNIAILILAAGSASRMGALKQLLPWGNSTLLGNAIAVASSCPATIFVVVGAEGKLIKKEIGNDVTFIDNEDWKKGLGASIASGVQHLIASENSYKICVIMLADQPFIDADYLMHIINTHNKNNKGITATTYENRVGVPVVFDSCYFEALSQLTGDQGAKEILEANMNDVQSIDPKGKTLDIDTKEEYQTNLN
ncbi:MAG: hypothetical protein COA50_05585 [Flavobacteriaceae bacterium]|nr:MAG: hypothetical protein COA50_05585 [Flavobacteriaceae bacterium]